MIRKLCIIVLILINFKCHATTQETPVAEKIVLKNISKISSDLSFMINLVVTADEGAKKKEWICDSLKDLCVELAKNYAQNFNQSLPSFVDAEILGFRSGTKIQLGTETFEEDSEKLQALVHDQIFKTDFIDNKRSHGFTGLPHIKFD